MRLCTGFTLGMLRSSESASKPFAVLLGLIAKKVTARERLLPILAHADFGNGGDVASREPLRGDGPFGDGTGDYTLPEPHSVFQLIAITYRKDALLSLVARAALRSFADTEALTIEEAWAGLDRWEERALAGEEIQIGQGDAVLELRAMQPTQSAVREPISPCDALRLMLEESLLTSEQAGQYLREVREERLAAETLGFGIILLDTNYLIGLLVNL